MILARDWLIPPTSQESTNHALESQRSTYLLLLLIYKINYVLDLVQRA